MARVIIGRNGKSGRRGMVAAQVALCMVPLCGVAAFAIDCGMMLEFRRRVQATADAAALSAANDLYAHYSANNGVDTGGSARTSALTTATANGFSGDGTQSTVTVHIPPTSGPFTGTAGFAEVIVTYYQPRGFSGIFGSGTIPVTARAVARGLWTTYANGIILLDPTASGALTDSGNGSITVNGGASIVIDSSSASAAVVSGNGSVSASQFVITGSPGDIVSGNGRFVGGIESGQTQTVDPLGYLPEPSAGGLSVQSNSQLSVGGNSSQSVSPGVYVGGISVSANASLTMSPGVYYMQGGGFTSSGNGNISGSGVLIFNSPNSTSDKISLAGNGNINLSPPTSGMYQGITMFQERTSSAPISITGNGSISLSGTVYAAHAAVTLSGNGGSNVVGGQYIASTMSVSGNGSVNMTWSSTTTSRTRRIGLVE
jgi:Putative Flp pilus-assembly TadE/G-like